MNVAMDQNFLPVFMYMDEGTQIRILSDASLEGVAEKIEDDLGLVGKVNSSVSIGGVITYVDFDKPIEQFTSGEIDGVTSNLNQSYSGIRDIRFESTGLVNRAPIAPGLQELLTAGELTPSMVITTGGDEDARLSAKQIEAVLRSGSLSVKVEVIEKLRVPPELGEEFVRNAVLAGFMAIVAVALVVFVRYRDTRIVIPIIATGLSEVIIILGIASLIKWNIDLPAIAGIIAAVGTGVDDQIVITDEVFMEKEKSLRHRMKSAFFIIMAAWMTTVAAMFPLFSIGLQILRGFALTTIIGVTIGVAVTRPAYASMIKNIIGGD
jgi:preprotein translocase subunit SecD